MKIACSAWLLMKPAYAPPYEDVVRTAGACGFDAVDLPVCDARELESYWTDAHVCSLRATLEEQRLALTQLCLFQNTMGGLGSPDPARVGDALEVLKRACALAATLGAAQVNLISPSPEGVGVGTTATLPEYFYLNTPDMLVPGMQAREVDGWRFDAKFRLAFPPGFDWRARWAAFVDAMRRAAQVAADAGVRLALENRNNTMTPHTDSMLRLLTAVDSDNLGATFNVAQAFLHRELLEWSAHKIGPRTFHVRACDGDGLACYNLPIDAGIIDWPGVLRGLDATGYDGYLSLEWLNDADCLAHAKRSVACLREMTAG